MPKLPMPFSNPDTYPGHSGVDFGQSRGTRIPASGPGVVTVVGPAKPVPGYVTWVRYDAFPNVEVGYAHQDTGDRPAAGTRVEEGSWLGYVGSRGLNSTGPHLHLEIDPGGTDSSVWLYFDRNRVVGGGGGGGGGALAPNQRRATSGGVRARREPTTASAEVPEAFIDEGEVGTFAGYVLGERIDGINGWAKGAFSGLYFWMGGLSPQNVDGLPDLTPAKPAEPNQRQATAGGVRGRQTPSTAAAQTAFLDEGEWGTFDGWRNGQDVEGEKRWLRGAFSGAWFWLGGLSPRSVAGLTDLNDTPPPKPDPDPPVDERVVYPQPLAATWDAASRWAHSSKCDPRIPGSKIELLILHGWGKFPNSAETEWRYFTGWQGPDQGSSPTWQINADGSVYEVVPPDAFRPWTTGSVDHRAVTVEAQPISGAPAWLYSAAQYERFAEALVFAHRRWGVPLQIAELTGTGKATKIVKPGLTQHNMTPAGRESGTACPGASLDLNRVLARAIEIITPTPEPEPPCDTVAVPRSSLLALRAGIDALLGGAP